MSESFKIELGTSTTDSKGRRTNAIGIQPPLTHGQETAIEERLGDTQLSYLWPETNDQGECYTELSFTTLAENPNLADAMLKAQAYDIGCVLQEMGHTVEFSLNIKRFEDSPVELFAAKAAINQPA